MHLKVLPSTVISANWKAEVYTMDLKASRGAEKDTSSVPP
jgi:hypothetical protein